MPNEPENRTEELLRQYAQKRRQQADPVRPLHPVNRRLLQEEVARIRAASGRKHPRSSWPSRLAAWWPRLAIPAVAVVITGVAVWMMTRPDESMKLSMAKQRVEGESASVGNESARTLAGEVNTPTPALAPPMSAPTPASKDLGLARGAEPGGTAIAEASGDTARIMKRLDEVAEAQAPARPPQKEDKDANVPLKLKAAEKVTLAGVADEAKPVAPADTRIEEARLNYSALKPSVSPAPAADPVGPSLAVTAASGTDSTLVLRDAAQAATNQTPLLAQQRGRYRRIAPGEPLADGARRRSAATRAGQAPAQPVMTSFEFIQTDALVEIRDGDGSVYSGAVLPSVESETLARQAGGAKRESDVSAASSLHFNAPAQFGAGAPAQGQVLFRVQGTNRTLNQRVILDGQLVSSSAALGGPGTAGSVRNAVQAVPPASPGSSSFRQLQGIAPGMSNAAQRIRGQLRVGTNETQIEAEPFSNP